MEPSVDIIRIDLPLEEYSKRRNVNKKECYLVLSDKYIEYKVVATHERLDEATNAWLDTKANWRFIRSRKMISDVSMYFDNKEQVYSLGLEFYGVSGAGNEWMFTDPKECLVIYNKLRQYFIDSLE